MKDTTAQGVLFNDLLNKPLIANFDQPDSSSDGGAILLKACDRQLGLIDTIGGCLRDDRQQGKVSHTIRDLIQQRVFGIACGYEDCNDSARPEVRPDAVSVRELTDLPWASFRHSITRLPLPSASTFKADIFDILPPDFVQGTSTPLDRAHAGHTQIGVGRQFTSYPFCCVAVAPLYSKTGSL